MLLAADYSQIELRLMAHFSQDDALVHAVNKVKMYRRTASEVLGITIEDVTNDQRRQAKTVNFGLLYGMSEFGLTRQLGFTREESRNYMHARYFNVIQVCWIIWNVLARLRVNKASLKPY